MPVTASGMSDALGSCSAVFLLLLLFNQLTGALGQLAEASWPEMVMKELSGG